MGGVPAQVLQRKIQRRALQRLARGVGQQDAGSAHEMAAQGIAGAGGPLPHLDALQKSFGRHDVTAVRVHQDARAAEASRQLGAEAYAVGDHVALGGGADLHTVAHEAAHVVQQRAGVHLKGGVGEAGDPYERHADAVADKVVRGESAEALLDEYAGAGQEGKRPDGPHTAGTTARGSGADEKPAAAPGDSLQLITRTVGGGPPVVIDINTLDDAGCREHLQRIGRIGAGHPQGNDAEYQYDDGDRAAIQARQRALLEERRVALVNALVAQLAALATVDDHQVQPPWNGLAPVGAEGPEVAGDNVEPVAATIVAAWTAFLGAGPYSHKHPRTGAVDNTRLVAADGQRSIRYGNHERNSNAGNHHFHQETWVYDAGANTITVNNTMRRASVR